MSEPSVMDGLQEAGRLIAESPTPRRVLRGAVLALTHYAEQRGLSGEDIGQVLREMADAFDP